MYKRWIWFTTFAATGLVLLLVTLPYGIRYGMQHWLLAMGAEQVSIENVDFNPFTGALVVHNVQADIAGTPVLIVGYASLHVSWLPLWHKRLHLTQLHIKHTEITVDRLDNGAWRLGGIRVGPSPDSTDTDPWGIGIDRLEVSNSRVRYLNHGLPVNMVIKDARLAALASWTKDRPAQLEFHGRIDDGRLNLKAKILPFAAQPRITGHLTLQGLTLKKFQEVLKPEVSELTGAVQANLDFEAKQLADNSVALSQRGPLVIRNLRAATPATKFAEKSLDWDGTLNLKFNPFRKDFRLIANGRLKGSLFSLSQTDDSLRVEYSDLAWDGQLDYGTQDVPTGYELAGHMTIDGLAVTNPAKKLTLARVGTLDLSGVRTKGTYHIAAAQIRLDRLFLADHLGVAGPETNAQEPPMLSVGEATLQAVEIKDLRSLTTGTVQLRDAVGTVRRDADGGWPLIGDLASKQSDKPSLAEGGPTPRAVRISSVQILGQSSLHFEDNTVTPAYHATIKLHQARIDDLDSTRPQQLSPFVLEGKLDKYSTLSLKGDIQPFSPRINLSLSGTLRDLDLPPLSPYTGSRLGYSLSSGHMSADISLAIKDDRLDGESRLLIDNLEIKTQNADRMKALTTRLDMPLDAALSMLRDKDNNVRLKLSVKGDLSNPRFDFGDAINQALGSAMRLAAVSYLKYALQPYGAIITLAELAGKTVGAVRLEPVLFKPGSAILDDKARNYLQRIANLMQERPRLRIRLCGRAVTADRTALSALIPTAKEPPSISDAKAPTESGAPPQRPAITDAQLRDLARRRAQVLKDYFVNQHSTDAQRLFVCQPKIDKQEHAEPRVDLVI